MVMNRWRGKISLTLSIPVQQMSVMSLDLLDNQPGEIIITFYVFDIKSQIPYIRMPKKYKTKRTFKDGIMPINLLRNFAIESISTTHYFSSDVDLQPTRSFKFNLSEA
jgi:hypothetical protein